MMSAALAPAQTDNELRFRHIAAEMDAMRRTHKLMTELGRLSSVTACCFFVSVAKLGYLLGSHDYSGFLHFEGAKDNENFGKQ